MIWAFVITMAWGWLGWWLAFRQYSRAEALDREATRWCQRASNAEVKEFRRVP